MYLTFNSAWVTHLAHLILIASECVVSYQRRVQQAALRVISSQLHWCQQDVHCVQYAQQPTFHLPVLHRKHTLILILHSTPLLLPACGLFL